jgi:rare lipoprotein A
VTNLENGRSVMVRINDRGPYLQGRVIDLSYQAASVLGYVEKGSAQVEVRYVGPAPLHGDDTRMLTASINKLTRYEQEQQTRLAMVEEPETVGFAGEDVVVQNGRINLADYQRSRGGYSETRFDFFGLFGYADNDPVNAAHAAANAMASRDTGLDAWAASVDEDARDIELRLGVFRDDGQAVRIAEAFALIGAVDERQVELGGDPATVLTLVHLKPGVRRDDVLVMAGELGLTDLILY